MKSVMYFDDDTVFFKDTKITQISTTFKKGLYKVTKDNRSGRLLITTQSFKEKLQPVESIESRQVLDTVDKFFDPEKRQKINLCGFIHKLGILLYGTQGTGKTSLFRFIAQQRIDKNDALVFVVNGLNSFSATVELIHKIRKVQTTPIIVIIDEIEAYCQENEYYVKEFTDGSSSVDTLLILSSTNYISKVPSTIRDRPSRFKLVIEYKPIEELDRILDVAQQIIKGRFGITEQQLREVFSTQGALTLDQIKHHIQDLIMGTSSTVERKVIGFTPSKQRRRPHREEKVLSSNI